MPILTIWPFLFVIITFLSVQNGATNSANKACRGFPVSEMILLRYKSAFATSLTDNNELVMIKMALRPVWRGKSERVYVGYTGSKPANSTFLPIDKCIAVKIYDYGSENGYKNSVKILDGLKNNESYKFEHISKMIDHGQIANGMICKDSFAAIYELGDKIFENELYFGKAYQKMSKIKIVNLIKEIVKTLAELHKVAIHLNFNPENLVVFFTEKRKFINFFTKGESKLKLIGLERSFFFGKQKKGKTKEDEIVCHSNGAASARYIAPEYLDNEITKFSPKLDIWSAGLVILEVLLTNFHNPSSALESIFPEEKMKVIKNKVDKISNFYRGFLIRKNDVKLEGTSEENEHFVKLTRNENVKLHEIGTASWWTYYGEVIHNIVNFWCQHDLQEIVFLITNMMDSNPAKRMSADEILDFLDGECTPKIGSADEMPIFGTLDADFLKNSLKAEIYRVQGIYEDYKKERLAFLEQIQTSLKKVGKCQKSLLSMLAKRKRICCAH